MTDGVRMTRQDRVLTITLDDPATLNALTAARADAMTQAITGAGTDGARAILLAGTGRAFCSGTNLAGELMPAGAFDAGATLEQHYNPLFEALRGSAVPVVTAVRGAAAGIGCSLALMGDVILAAESAYFVTGFGRIGLVPDGGAAFLLAHAIGRVRAMEMLLLNERVPAARALDWGLVTRVVADEALDAAAAEVAGTLASGPASFGATRRAAWAALETGFADQLARERHDQRDAARTADFLEGIAAFRDKRPPRFRGK